MSHLDRITSSEDILFGKPRIKGTRISVEQILEYLSEGYTIKEILKFHKDLKKSDVQGCIEYAMELVSSIKVVTPKLRTLKKLHA